MAAEGRPTVEVADFGDAAVRRRNEEAGHTLCGHCSGTGNELYAMYRTCPECDGGIAVRYGELSSFGKWCAERKEERERKRLARKYRAPRDWEIEIRWRLSRWLGIGQCFHGSKDTCRHCEVWAHDVDYEVRRVGPFRCECIDRQMCREMADENNRAEAI